MKGRTEAEEDYTRGIVWNEVFIQDPAAASALASTYPPLVAHFLVLLFATYQAHT